MAQITLNSSGVASNGTLALQSNGTTTAVTIDASQNVGIGTSSPSNPLHVVGAIPARFMANSAVASSSYGGVIVARTTKTALDGTGIGFNLNNSSDTSVEYGYIGAAIETNTAGGQNGAIIFSPAAGSTRTERMRITSAGDVGIGTSSSVTYKLDVRGNAGFSTYTGSDYQLAAVSPSGADRQVFLAGVSGVSNGLTVRYISGAMQYTLTGLANGTVSSSGGVLSASSDQDKKVADGEVLSAIDKVLSLKPRYFYWKDTDGNANEEAGRQLGFFAQEVNTIVPEASPEPKGKDEGWGIYDRSLVAVLTKAIQEQQAIITSLTDRITALEAK